MTTLLKNFASLILFIPLCSFKANDCGEYRWDYKIFVDPTGWPLLNKKTTNKTILNLVHLHRPENLGKQRTPYETWKVTVTAWMAMLGNEDDGDYHLVLTSDDKTDSLIAEIPNQTCNKLQHFPLLGDKYSKARDVVDEDIKEPTSQIKKLDNPVKVKITGFLFFDKIAHGKGHAKNGIEIHPVISIKSAD